MAGRLAGARREQAWRCVARRQEVLGRAATSSGDTGASAGSAAKGKNKKRAGSGSAGLVGVLSDPKALRRMLLAAKIIGPAVAAGALRTSTGVRGVLDERRARQLGVPVEDVAAFRGRPAPCRPGSPACARR